jgi:hypothetical protein
MHEINPVTSENTVAEQLKKSTPIDRETVEKMIEDAKDEVIQHASEQVQKTQDSFMTIFGLFSAILSFLTIEFQFLRTLSHVNQILGFSLLLASLLLSFNLTLDYMVTKRFNHGHKKYYCVAFLIVAFLGLGVFFVLQTPGTINNQG